METRIQKYKDYRSSFIKEGSQNYNGQTRFTTSTLPLNEVMSTVSKDEKDEELIRKNKNLKILRYVIAITICVAIIVGVVFLGIFAFKG